VPREWGGCGGWRWSINISPLVWSAVLWNAAFSSQNWPFVAKQRTELPPVLNVYAREGWGCVAYLFSPLTHPFLESRPVSCKFYKICLKIVLPLLVGLSSDPLQATSLVHDVCTQRIEQGSSHDWRVIVIFSIRCFYFFLHHRRHWRAFTRTNVQACEMKWTV